MPSNLRDRLRLIQGHKKAEPARHDSPRLSVFLDKGWASCGYLALKREVFLSAPVEIPARLPEALPILIPDLSRGAPPLPEDFLFFDLETTGLSGGAGTVAFLAAFGKIVSSGKLLVTQYLLLDYPGENDFLDAALGEFQNERAVITSYNGKCFDSPLLAARCLMNGKTPPEYRHADLLHPARRLWKTITNDCSQKSVEMNILKYDRGGDVPGALAPEIWFDFLRTGDAGRLFGICDHNVSDIAGLASILAAIIQIAADPFADKYPFDRGRLALRWRDYIRRVYAQRAPCPRPPEKLAELRDKGKRLLRLAAGEGHRACLTLARDLFMEGSFEEGRERLHFLAEGDFPDNAKAAALRLLAVDSERRLQACEEAFKFAKRGLDLAAASAAWGLEFERRLQRLGKKLLLK